MKVWIFLEDHVNCEDFETWPCVFSAKSDADAWLASWAKQNLPNIAKEHLEYANEERAKGHRRDNCDCCVTYKDAKHLLLLVNKALEFDSVATWLTALTFAQQHEFEDVFGQPKLIEVPVLNYVHPYFYENGKKFHSAIVYPNGVETQQFP